MVKKAVSIITVLLYVLVAGAQERYSFPVEGGYRYNKTLAHTGEVALRSHMPVHPHLELDAGVLLSGFNEYGLALDISPKVVLPVGELYWEADLRYTAAAYAHQHDIAGAVGMGYRMDYVSVCLGYYARRLQHTAGDGVTEWGNLLYDIDVFVRPQSSCWNLWVSVGNRDEFRLERMWSPMGRLGAWYDINAHWRVRLQAQLQLAGVFHMNAEPENAYVRTGFVYKL